MLKKKNLFIITSLLLIGACGVTPSQKTGQQPISDKTADPATRAEAGTADLQPLRPIPTNQWALEELPTATGEFDNVWDRLRAGMTMPHHTDQEAVRNKLEWYGRHQGYLDRVAERATPYLHYIVEQLEERGLPMELALLPVIESAYQPLAYSRSHAAGIWQFIPATGDRYGLKQNWWYDGRRDITAATTAALDYLEFLRDQFDGDWLQALAGYNAGENTVLRAMERNRQAGRPTAFWYLSLPRETRNYVPALLALSALVASPADYGVTLKPIANEPYFDRVATGGQVDLNRAAELAGISEAEMKRLNPGFKRWATDPDGPHELLIPVARVETFASALEALPQDQRLTWRQHRIRQGETLGQIARRYDTTVAVLQHSNNLGGSLIRAGQHLLIPAPGAEDSEPPAALAERSRGDSGRHVVRPGESLWAIARRHGHSVASLSTVNNINEQAVLQPGQTLRLPGNAAGGAATDNSGPVRYTVRQGDSLWTISRRFQVSVNELREWNQLQQRSLLQPGQELELYVDNSQPHDS